MLCFSANCSMIKQFNLLYSPFVLSVILKMPLKLNYYKLDYKGT